MFIYGFRNVDDLTAMLICEVQHHGLALFNTEQNPVLNPSKYVDILRLYVNLMEVYVRQVGKMELTDVEHVLNMTLTSLLTFLPSITTVRSYVLGTDELKVRSENSHEGIRHVLV